VKEALLSVMRCPDCSGGPLSTADAVRDDGAVLSGTLVCGSCKLVFPIEKGIPRVLPAELLTIGGQEKQEWEKTYEQIEDQAIDDDRRSYKKRHREGAAQAGISEEQSNYLWENLLYEEAYESFQDVPETHGLSWTRTQEAVARRNALIFELIEAWEPDLTNKLVLNAGAAFDSDIGERFRGAGARLLNSDIVAPPLETLHERNGQEGLCADLRRLPFLDDSLDIVVCIEVIHHCHPLVDTLVEIRRVLKPGGGIVVVENTLSHPGTWPGRILPKRLIRAIRKGLRRSFGKQERYLKVSPYEQVVPPREVLRVLRESGFREIEKKVSQYAIPVFSTRLVDAWERWGRRWPRAFTPTAFELTYFGRK
jgi:SAM-dependent methyltransferase/uncharacterized protein YbaR (Trm112 family)